MDGLSKNLEDDLPFLGLRDPEICDDFPFGRFEFTKLFGLLFEDADQLIDLQLTEGGESLDHSQFLRDIQRERVLEESGEADVVHLGQRVEGEEGFNDPIVLRQKGDSDDEVRRPLTSFLF